MTNEHKNDQAAVNMPSMERIQQELASAKSIDDFFGGKVSLPGCLPPPWNK